MGIFKEKREEERQNKEEAAREQQFREFVTGSSNLNYEEIDPAQLETLKKTFEKQKFEKLETEKEVREQQFREFVTGSSHLNYEEIDPAQLETLKKTFEKQKFGRLETEEEVGEQEEKKEGIYLNISNFEEIYEKLKKRGGQIYSRTGKEINAETTIGLIKKDIELIGSLNISPEDLDGDFWSNYFRQYAKTGGLRDAIKSLLKTELQKKAQYKKTGDGENGGEIPEERKGGKKGVGEQDEKKEGIYLNISNFEEIYEKLKKRGGQIYSRTGKEINAETTIGLIKKDIELIGSLNISPEDLDGDFWSNYFRQYAKTGGLRDAIKSLLKTELQKKEQYKETGDGENGGEIPEERKEGKKGVGEQDEKKEKQEETTESGIKESETTGTSLEKGIISKEHLNLKNIETTIKTPEFRNLLRKLFNPEEEGGAESGSMGGLLEKLRTIKEETKEYEETRGELEGVLREQIEKVLPKGNLKEEQYEKLISDLTSEMIKSSEIAKKKKEHEEEGRKLREKEQKNMGDVLKMFVSELGSEEANELTNFTTEITEMGGGDKKKQNGIWNKIKKSPKNIWGKFFGQEKKENHKIMQGVAEAFGTGCLLMTILISLGILKISDKQK